LFFGLICLEYHPVSSISLFFYPWSRQSIDRSRPPVKSGPDRNDTAIDVRSSRPIEHQVAGAAPNNRKAIGKEKKSKKKSSRRTSFGCEPTELIPLWNIERPFPRFTEFTGVSWVFNEFSISCCRVLLDSNWVILGFHCDVLNFHGSIKYSITQSVVCSVNYFFDLLK